jgi:glucokinase
VVIDPSGSVVARVRRPDAAAGGQAVVEACVESAEELLAAARSGGLAVGPIAIAMPGTIDKAGGVVIDAPVLSMRDVPIVEIAHRAVGHPVTVLHDVKAAAFGELVAGAGIGQADVAYLNLGTGVSMAFVFGWKVHQGSSGTAGRDRARGRRPGRAALQLRSARLPGDRGLRPGHRPGGGTADGRLESVAEAARRGDERAVSALNEAAEHIGRVLGDFMMVMDVGTLMVGGGVSPSARCCSRRCRPRSTGSSTTWWSR